MTQQAMASYARLAGSELWNQARLQAYVRHGVRPPQYGFATLPPGCQGLLEILPDIGVTVPVDGYQLPELDPAPWYDVNVPESKNFAGFLVTSVTLSSPYNRPVTSGVGDGWNLGRLQTMGRTIVAHGFIIAKTCCAAAYGKSYLTAMLGSPDCANSGGCGGGTSCGTHTLEFLGCCPAISGEDDCLRINDGEGGTETYVRSDGPSEWESAASFFRRMNGVGVVSGPEILGCRGGSCGSCGACGSVLEFEVTLAAESGFLNSLGEVIFSAEAPDSCEEDPETCQITWVTDEACDPEDPEGLCTPAPGCVEDPFCPPPALPPQPRRSMVACGCSTPLQAQRICANVDTIREWGSSTLVTTVSAGAEDLRNLVIRVWDNPDDEDCADCLDGGGVGDIELRAVGPVTLNNVEILNDFHVIGGDGCLGDGSDATYFDSMFGWSTAEVTDALQVLPPGGSYVQADINLHVRLSMTGGGASPGEVAIFLGNDPDGTSPSEVAGFAPAGGWGGGTGFYVPLVDGTIQDLVIPLRLTPWGASVADVVAALEAGAYLIFNTAQNVDFDTDPVVRIYEASVVLTGDEPPPTPCPFPDCDACSTLLVSYIPAGGVLTVDGENRRVTLECGGVVRSAAQNITDVQGRPFTFPELTCRPLVVSAQFDCANISPDASVVITRVDRDL